MSGCRGSCYSSHSIFYPELLRTFIISSISICTHLFLFFQVKLLPPQSLFCSRSSLVFVSIATCYEKSDSCKEQTLSSSRIPTSSVVSMVTYAYPYSVSLDAVIKLTDMQVKEILYKRGNVRIA
jgi:hypothetical protein